MISKLTVNIDEKDAAKEDGGAQIESFGQISVPSEKGNFECLCIIGQIEGHFLVPENQKATKYEHIMPKLLWAEQSSDVKGLLLLINTMGGDVEAGLAIAEMISSMSKPTVSLVLGGSHSIGVPLAVCCKKSFIVPSATMMIHPVRITGTVVGAPQTYAYFEKMQDRITKFVCKNSRVSEQDFKNLMMKTDEIATDVGAIIDGELAKKMGLIDEIGGLKEAIAALELMSSQ